MHHIHTFAFGDQLIRVLGTEEKPLFVAADICGALGIQNSRDAVADFTDKESWIYHQYIPDNAETGSEGGPQDVVVVTEPGLYRLIFRSDKPTARAFQDWLFQEVLPVIRKTGSYGLSGREEWLREALTIARTGAVQEMILRALLPQAAPTEAVGSPDARGSAPHGEEFPFFENLIEAWQAGAISLLDFRAERTGTTLDACFLYLYPLNVLTALSEWLRKSGRKVTLQRRELRKQFAGKDYWVGKPPKKRFGRKRFMATRTTWGFRADLHPLWSRDTAENSPKPSRASLVEFVEAIINGHSGQAQG
jgi:prophage antirepressor-like protein